jgi:hypothetical protein
VHKEELHNTDFPSNIIRIFKSRTIWAELVERTKREIQILNRNT